MDLTKNQLIQKGWIFIGVDGSLEYYAKENEHGEIIYIPVHNDKTVGIVRTISKNVLSLLFDFIKKDQ